MEKEGRLRPPFFLNKIFEGHAELVSASVVVKIQKQANWTTTEYNNQIN